MTRFFWHGSMVELYLDWNVTRNNEIPCNISLNGLKISLLQTWFTNKIQKLYKNLWHYTNKMLRLDRTTNLKIFLLLIIENVYKNTYKLPYQQGILVELMYQSIETEFQFDNRCVAGLWTMPEQNNNLDFVRTYKGSLVSSFW